MKNNIEIEVRGPLSKEQFETLSTLLQKEGQKITDKNRILIDYSTFLEDGIENRKKDIRLRVTNGIPEIIVKIGEWGGTDQRKELSILASQGDFDTLVQIFGELGYNKGVLCVRRSKVYRYKGIEFALVEVPGHSYFFEAEKMGSEQDNLEKITEDIKLVCSDLKLNLFDNAQFFNYIEQLNKEANKVFDYAEYTTNYFKSNFDL